MDFDVTMFAEIGRWIFNTGMYVFSLFNFNFGDYELNGLAIIIGSAVFGIICFLFGRLSDINN